MQDRDSFAREKARWKKHCFCWIFDLCSDDLKETEPGLTLSVNAMTHILPLTVGIHHGIPPDVYRRDDLTVAPALTASTAKTILRNPARAFVAKSRPPDPRRCSEFGIAAHIAFLERERWEKSVAIMAAESYRTMEARNSRDDARSRGVTPLLPAQAETLQNMALAMRNELPGVQCDTAADFLGDIFTGGHAEVTAIAGDDPIMKIRPDYVREGDGFDVLVDYKTDGRTDSITWKARTERWDFRAAFYEMVWKIATGREASYLFVVQETEWPYFVRHALYDPSELAVAKAEIIDAMAVYRECMATGHWPSGVEDPIILQANRREN